MDSRERNVAAANAPAPPAPTPLSKREATMSYLEGKTGESSGGAASTAKKKSPTSAAIVREGLKPNLSAAEATSQLKVLCRKFAALTEKVKEETKVREEAEREVRRLKAIVDGNNNPVISSCRAESQAYIRELKEAHDRTKQELRFEKDKNAMLVSKALELEREKNALLAAQSAAASPDAAPSRQVQWDKEQMHKIQATLQMTIDELQDELTRKEEELESFRERTQRERGRTKQLELEIRSKEHVEREAEQLKEQLEAELRAAEEDIAVAHKQSDEADARAEEERVVRETLEEQLATLNEVNAVLEQRCNALIRRVDLSASVIQDGRDLKLQLRDAEIDNETLVRSMRELKDAHFRREKELKVEVEKALDAKRQVEAHVAELEADVASLRAQNSLFSEWMLVRNENALIARTEHSEPPTKQSASPLSPALRCSPPSRSHHSSARRAASNRASDPVGAASANEAPPASSERGLYVHISRAPLSPTTTRSMTTASPIKQQSWRAPTLVHDPPLRSASAVDAAPLSAASRAARVDSSPETSSPQQQQRKRATASTSARLARKMSTASAASSSSSSTVSSSANADHDRLRVLMSRNRELQQRLQQETLATHNLEQEITDMATSYTHRQRPAY